MNKGLLLCLLGLSLSFRACAGDQATNASSYPDTSSIEKSKPDPVSSDLSQLSSESTEDLAFETTWEIPTPSAETSPINESGLTLSLEPPAGWVRADDSFFLAKFTKGTATFLVSEESYFSDQDLDIVVSESKQMLSGIYDEVVFVGEPDIRSVGDHEGRHFLMTCIINGVPVTSSYTYLPFNGRIYSLILSETSDLWPELASEEDLLFANIMIR